MSFIDILYEVEDRIATISLNHPKTLNAVTPNMIVEMMAALDAAARDGSVSAILLTGSGRGFSSGADLASGPTMGSDGRPDLGETLDKYYNPLITKMQSLQLPIVAAVNGIAAGAGASLAFMADIAVASRSAFFLEAFINVGLMPDAGATWVLSRVLGPQRTLALTLLGEKISAEQAKQWGLIWDVVDDDQLMTKARSLAGRLAAGPRAATLRIKSAVYAASQNNMQAQLALESRYQRECGRTDDFLEGVKAFAEKRKPIFSAT